MDDNKPIIDDMAGVTVMIIKIPNEILDRVIEAMCEGDPTPTLEEAKTRIIRLMEERVGLYEADKTARTGYEQAKQKAKNEIILS